MLFLCRSRKLNRKRNIRARISAVLISAQILSLLTLMTGCGSKDGDIPALQEPVSANVSYRPVGKRVVGKKEIMYGKVVPREYPCFTKDGVDLAEINVAVGDYVNEGDVIATAVSVNDEAIKALNNQIASLSRQRTNKKEVSDKTLEKLEYEKRIEEYLQDNDGVQQKEKEIAKENEDQRYNLSLIDKRISAAKAEIADLQKQSEAEVFTAPYSGYVTFVKDFSQSNHVEPNENIAVVADMDELYIESSEKTIDNYAFEDYENKWTYLNGKKVYFTERRYTQEEVSCAKAIKANPYMQFEIPGEKLTIGTNMVLYFMDSDDSEKLVVGNDSIYRNNEEEFVYVKGAEGSNSDEKRVVKLGVSDENYTEVLSGLDEGELVYYSNNAAVPTKYEVAEIGLEDYNEVCETQFVNLLNPYSKLYTSEYSGKILELHSVGKASAGDTLYTLSTNIKNADIEEARSTMEELDTSREKTRRQYEKNKSDLEEVLKAAHEASGEEMATDSDAVRESMFLAERTQCELDILDYNENYSKQEYSAQKAIAEAEYQKLNKDGFDAEKNYTIEVDRDGSINSNGPQRNTKLEKYQYIVTQQYSKDEPDYTRIHVSVDSKDPSMPSVSAMIGEEITLVNKEKSWTGKCLGINGDAKRSILFTRDGDQYTTFSSPYNKGVEYQFDMSIDADISEADLKDAKVKFNAMDVRQAVVVPGTSVKSEYDQLKQKDIYYVWKLENGEVVKEFVTIHDTVYATGKVYILDGVEVGDQLLK